MGRLSVQSTQHGRSDTQGGLGSLFHAEPELSALKMYAITTSFSLLLNGHFASLSFAKAFRSLLHYTSDSFLFQLAFNFDGFIFAYTRFPFTYNS